MKKRMARVLSLLLASVLVLSFAQVVRAEDASTDTTEVQAEAVTEDAAEEEIAEEETADAVEESSEDANVASDESQTLDPQELEEGAVHFNYTNVATGAEAVPSYLVSTHTKEKEQGKTEYIFSNSVKFSSNGVLKLTVQPLGTGKVTVGLYKDKKLEDAYYEKKDVAVGQVEELFVDVSAQTDVYYIGVKSTKGEHQAYLSAAFYDSSDRTLTSGQQIAVGQTQPGTQYFQITTTADGYLKTDAGSSAQDYKVTLLDSSKSEITGETTLGNMPTFGVKAGQTYYIRVRSTSVNKMGYYIFKATNTKVTEKSGSKKSKAVTIKSKTNAKGTITIGSNRSDWYKFKLNGKKRVQLSVKVATNNKIRVSILNKKGKTVKKIDITPKNNYKTLKLNTSKLSKGTYYIKVQKVGSDTSGFYALKWK